MRTDSLLADARHEQWLEEACLLRHPPLKAHKSRISCEAGQAVPAERPVGGAADLDAPFPVCWKQLEVFQIVMLAVLVPVPELKGDGPFPGVGAIGGPVDLGGVEAGRARRTSS